MELVDEDCKSLLEQVNAQEKQQRNKRRWLLGLLASEDANGFNLETTTRPPIPESLLREDDVTYDIIKSLVEKGVCDSKNKYHISEDEMQLVHSPRDVRGVLHLVKDMTNQGLDRFLQALTGTSFNLEKIRWKMKQTIKGCLLSSSLSKHQKIQLSENQSAVLKNPHNYLWSSQSRFIPADSDSYRAAVYKVLDSLEALPTPTLLAMHRKIRGIKGYTPQLVPPKRSGWGRDSLIKHLRKNSLKLLSNLKQGDSLQEPLAKAMDVAGLTLKLIQGCDYATNFLIQPSPETNAMQNEIAKCIKLLDQRVELWVLKDIEQALNAAGENIADRSLRALVRNLLTEYLCECADMEIVPECLHQVLAIIRKSCKAPPYKENVKIEENVESVLGVGASMKQLVWDLIPPSEDEKLDQQFADAYMEDLKGSYEDEDEDEDEVEDDDITSPASTGRGNVNLSQHMHLMRHHLVSLKNTQQEEVENARFHDQTSACRNNQYLAVQAATDEASMVAYRLIDHISNDHAQIQEQLYNKSSLGIEEVCCKPKKRKATTQPDQEEEYDGTGSSLLFTAVEELLPSLAKKCEGLKKMKLKLKQR